MFDYKYQLLFLVFSLHKLSDAPNNPEVASSIIPTFQIRKLKHREAKKLFKFATLVDEKI